MFENQETVKQYNMEGSTDNIITAKTSKIYDKIQLKNGMEYKNRYWIDKYLRKTDLRMKEL